MTSHARRSRAVPHLVALALLLGAALPAARADRPMQPGKPLPLYQAECGSCHLAFQPALLPAASWDRLMGGLDRHFGTDATLDPQSAATIAAWLRSEAGTGRRMRTAPPEDRITRSDWFRREHDELRPAIWQRASIKSPANCAACHTGAERGDYDEDAIRIPR